MVLVHMLLSVVVVVWSWEKWDLINSDFVILCTECWTNFGNGHSILSSYRVKLPLNLYLGWCVAREQQYRTTSCAYRQFLESETYIVLLAPQIIHQQSNQIRKKYLISPNPVELHVWADIHEILHNRSWDFTFYGTNIEVIHSDTSRSHRAMNQWQRGPQLMSSFKTY